MKFNLLPISADSVVTSIVKLGNFSENCLRIPRLKSGFVSPCLHAPQTPAKFELTQLELDPCIFQ